MYATTSFWFFQIHINIWKLPFDFSLKTSRRKGCITFNIKFSFWTFSFETKRWKSKMYATTSFWFLQIHINIWELPFDFSLKTSRRKGCITFNIKFSFRTFSFETKRWKSKMYSTTTLWFLQIHINIWELPFHFSLKTSRRKGCITFNIKFSFRTFSFETK